MLDLLNLPVFGFPLWLWVIVVGGAIIVVTIIIARKMEFEGVNLTATPPFVTFRFKRKQTLRVSENPKGLAAPINLTITGGDAQIAQGDGARQIQTHGAPYIEHAKTVNLAPPERAPRGSAAPPTRTKHYVHRGKIETDVRAALAQRDTVAVVGVAGMGGIGKSELAKQLWRELADAQRVIYLEVRDRSLAILHGELARALGITFPPTATDESRGEILRAVFHDQPHIVIFDDVYRVSIPALKFLIPPSPSAALITSRQRELGGGVRVFELDVMDETQSFELLREAHNLGDVIAREEDAARELCRLCGYLPLALDIAASRLRKQLHFSATPVAAFNRALENRLKELQRGAQPTRDDSITANIAISYDALDDADRRRLRALAVFAPSGFAPRAAGAVWGETEADACGNIERLQDESLVMNAETLGRFRLHDLVRDFAWLKLNEVGASETTNRAHCEFLIALFEKHSMDDLSNAPEVGEELDNLRAAVKWAREKRDGEMLARLATTPRNWLYNIFRAWDDWLGWLNDALRVGKDYDPRLKANVLKAIGDVQQFRDERDAALESYAHALALFRSVGDRLGEANVLQAIGDVQQFRKDNDAALESYAHALALFRSVGARLGEANVLQAIGDVQQFRDERDAALESYAHALALFRSVGARLGEANVYLSLGGILRVEKKFDQARENFRSALASYQTIGDLYSQARALYRLGDCDADEAKWRDAVVAYRQAAQIWNDLGMTNLVDEILRPRIENAEKNIA